MDDEGKWCYIGTRALVRCCDDEETRGIISMASTLFVLLVVFIGSFSFSWFSDSMSFAESMRWLGRFKIATTRLPRDHMDELSATYYMYFY